MKIDRLLILLIVIVIVAAGVVYVSKRPGPADEPEAVVEVEDGALELLVIGVEGFDRDIVERLSAEGRLPNLTALMSNGSVGGFTTLGAAVDRRISWTSLVTGVSPERQGVGGTITSSRGTTVSASLVPKARTVGTLWTAVADGGDAVGVLGWWGSWPVEQLNGVVVAPYMTYHLERRHNSPSERLLHPTELYETVDALIVGPERYSRRDLSRYVDLTSRLGLEALIGVGYTDLAMAHAADQSMRDLSVTLSNRGDIDALFVLLPGVELVSQRFWHMAHPDEIDWSPQTQSVSDQLIRQIDALGGLMDRFYEVTDERIGELVRLAADGATIAVVSDHGYDRLRYSAEGHPLTGANMYDETGFWVIEGPGVVSGATVEGLSLLDFAPTVAEAAGVVLKDETDGRACADMLRR